jgi:hypothetical protein
MGKMITGENDEKNAAAVEHEAVEAAVDDPSRAPVVPHLEELPQRSRQEQTTCWSEKKKKECKNNRCDTSGEMRLTFEKMKVNSEEF